MARVRNKLAAAILVGAIGVSSIMAGAETRDVVHNGSYNITFNGNYNASGSCSDTTGSYYTVSCTASKTNTYVEVNVQTYINYRVEPGVVEEVKGPSYATDIIKGSTSGNWSQSGFDLTKAVFSHYTWEFSGDLGSRTNVGDVTVKP